MRSANMFGGKDVVAPVSGLSTVNVIAREPGHQAHVVELVGVSGYSSDAIQEQDFAKGPENVSRQILVCHALLVTVWLSQSRSSELPSGRWHQSFSISSACTNCQTYHVICSGWVTGVKVAVLS